MRIPGYQIERLVAEGGMSSVYRALQASLGRPVALKVLKHIDSLQQAERFLREARIVAALQHRNIVTIHDFGSADERYYIAMEFLEGGTLADRIENGLPAEQALDLLEAIAACLDFVHGCGVVHRDIKPGNILFHADGTPKLSDFGIARQLATEQENTLEGSALGSPYYLSPEQAEGRSPDGRSDIYSLGIVFYQMLTGRRPYAEGSHIETIVAHLSHPIPVLPEPFAAYQRLLEDMIAKDPADRIGSAAELVERVQAVRAGRAYPPKARSARHDGPGLLGRTSIRLPLALGLLAGSVGLGVWLVDSDPAPPPAAPAVTGPINGPATDQITSPVAAPVAATVATSSNGTAPVPLVAPPVPPPVEVAVDLEATTGPAPPASEPGQPVTGPALEAAPAPVAEALFAAHEEAPALPIEAAQVKYPRPPDEQVHRQADSGSDELSPPAAAESVVSADAEQSTDSAQVESAPDSQAARIDDLMRQAQTAFQALRLTRPAGGSAYDRYLEVLELAPGHADAEAGIDAIAARYAAMAERSLAEGDLERARLYLRRGRQVRPDHPGLASAQQVLTAAETFPPEVEPIAAEVPAEPQDRSPQESLRGPGSGNMVKDFQKLWRSVFE